MDSAGEFGATPFSDDIFTRHQAIPFGHTVRFLASGTHQTPAETMATFALAA
jgi:hypothetical protein